MHWASCSAESDIGPQYCWLPRISAERRKLEAEIMLRSHELEEEMNGNRRLAGIPGNVETCPR